MTTRLIEELKKDHAAIFDCLDRAKELGINTAEGQKSILAAKSSRLGHLAKEDEKLYPLLRKAAEVDNKTKSLLDAFARDMEGVSKAATDFLNKYAGGGSGIEFARDFGRFFITLKMRMTKEESILYKEFDKLASPAA